MKPYCKGWPFFILYVYVSECEPGKFGSNCVHKCDCDGDTPCDPVSGRCLCAPGKMGSRCDIGEPIHQISWNLTFSSVVQSNVYFWIDIRLWSKSIWAWLLREMWMSQRRPVQSTQWTLHLSEQLGRTELSRG